MLAVTGGRDYLAVKGVIETILADLRVAIPTSADDAGMAI